jgi:lipoprotein-anchoring transpeptidase ErfK/SrfK
VRICVRCAVIAVTIVGSLGEATAQPYDYPPSRDYYGAPPNAYGPALGGDYAQPLPSSNVSAPVPPVAIGTPAPPSSYNPGYRQAATAAPGDPPASGPSYARPDRTDGGIDGQLETNQTAELPLQFRRQLVDSVTAEPAGTIIIDTPHTFLYLMLGHGKALRYGIGVGRKGFTWSGTERISRMSKWPDWHPPKEMIARQPYLPRFTAGGEGNPLGARALYLGNTEYRIHGTNQPATIGHFVSSGCIRLTNEDVEDLYNRVNVGTRVVVLPGSPPLSVSAEDGFAR